MIIVRSFAVDIESLSDERFIPSVDELRPACCPGCENPARPPGGRFGIIGHGTYRRQVLGLGLNEKQAPVIFIRRYLCLGCDRTISVLPDALIPWRWYCGAAILAVLVGTLLLGVAVANLCDSKGPGQWSTTHWTTPARWASQVGQRLWHWRAREINYGPAVSSSEAVGRLLGLVGAQARSPDSELEAAARRLVDGSTHLSVDDARSSGRPL